MARSAGGQVVVDTRGAQPRYALRFRAYGKRHYVALGSAADGWTRAKAVIELENILADVRRGIWKPPTPAPAPQQDADPTFHKFASDWYSSREGAWRPKTREHYRWQLSLHLLPFFGEHRLQQITVAEVDRYRSAKLAESQRLARAHRAWEIKRQRSQSKEERRQLYRERPPRPLSPRSINTTIATLSQILEVAAEYDLIARNTARGKRRKLRTEKPKAVWLDSAGQIRALLDAAGELDRAAGAQTSHIARRAVLATLTFAGLRIGELCALAWRDVDLASGRITVRSSKTAAGVRSVDLLPALREELSALKARKKPSAEEPVFCTTAGGPQNPANIRNRVLAPAIDRANSRLAAAGETPLPEGLTPHKLRHTYASILVALGSDPGATMDQLGHTNAAFTLGVYRHGMRRDQRSKRELEELVGVGGTLESTSRHGGETWRSRSAAQH